MSNLPQYDEKVLLQQIAEGSKKAFETIYNQHYISVFYFTKRFVPDIQAAEDITTETFMKLWEKLKNFESLQAIKSFLYISTKNACLNLLRSEQRQSMHQKQLSYLLTEEMEDAMAQHKVTARIYQYIYDEIEKLPPQLKVVFKMAYLDGLSNEKIARELSINNQSVRNHKSRALKSLRMTMLNKDILEGTLLFLLFNAIL